MTLRPPEPLEASHDVAEFDSGISTLDDWLKRRALVNQASGATRTFVLCEAERVVGYYALASGAVRADQSPGRFRRNMPDPVPVVILARLAIDRSCQNRGLGRALVKDAASRILAAANAIGIRGILVHAISPEAEAFYRSLGFVSSPLDPRTLMITLADLRQVIAAGPMS